MKLVGVIVVLLLTSADARADERTILRLRGWINAVDAHAAGRADSALAVVTAWTYDDLELMRPYVEVLVLAPSARNSERVKRRRRLGRDGSAIGELTRSLESRGDFDVFRKRAAMLHTDAAMLGSLPLVVTPPTPQQRADREQGERRVDVKSFDGQVTHFELRNLHWEFAMDVLDSVPAKPARDAFVGRWYRAIGAYFARERRFSDAIVHFDRARDLVPDDAGVLYGEACLQETLGAPRIQDYVRVTTLPNGLSILGVSSPQTHFRRAEALLRKALAADPQLVVASLRLGRVLTRLQRPDEALTHLRTTIARATDPETTYYGHLFAGDAAEALGDVDAARRHYENAIAVFPAFDVSSSVAGARLDQLKAASQTLTAELQPGDQSSLVTFNEVVALPCPLSFNRSCVRDALNATQPDGETALVDGVLAGIMVGESDVGRSLLMVFSDGLDTASFLHADRVLDVGRRSDVVVYPITSKGARPDFIEELASLTGGRLHEVDHRSDLSAAFRSILDEFRHRYLVTYTPRGVPRGGWHTLDVRVNRNGATVKARPGYQGL